MDLFTRWSQKIIEGPAQVSRGHDDSVTNLSRRMLLRHLDLWWSQPPALPGFPFAFSDKEHFANEKRLDGWVSGLIAEIKHLPADAHARLEWQERLRPGLTEFGRTALNLEQRHLDFIESSGMIEASQEFARMARRFDPAIRAEDIYQAGRNVMTMNMLQALFGLPVEIT